MLNHFQGRACKVVFAVMKGLWIWALVCTCTAIHWDNEKSPSLSALWKPGQCCKLNKPCFEISVRRKSVFQGAWKHLLFALLPNTVKKITEMNVRHGLYDKIYRACLILPFGETANSPCWSAVNLTRLAQKPTHTNNRPCVLLPVGSCWKALGNTDQR